jgi:hypothetical protein
MTCIRLRLIIDSFRWLSVAEYGADPPGVTPALLMSLAGGGLIRRVGCPYYARPFDPPA